MKLLSRLLIALALLTTGGAALAQQGHRDHDRHDQRHERNDHRGNDRERRSRHDTRRHDHPRPIVHRDYRRYGYQQPRHYQHRWQRGHRYTGPVYVVRDYGYYRLRPPPRGYRWVRADNNYLLVAIATGIILDVAMH